jgi:hypothetical protein
MKSISYKIALERAIAAARVEHAEIIKLAVGGDQGARSYLRSYYTTVAEYDQLNPQRPVNEDGPCAGWGCDVTIIS